MKANQNLLNYRNKRFKKKDCIIDIHDGKKIDAHFKDMERIFLEVRRRFEANNGEELLYQCSLGFTIFYDGITLFKRKSDSVSPLLCSVVNCNPSERSKLGGALFMNMLHNLRQNSGAEKYLIREMLTKEYKLLEKGFIIRIPHPEPKHPGQRVAAFLQARCLTGHLDLIEFQKFLGVMGNNSRPGCVRCGNCNGRKVEVLSKSVYTGHRALLHPNHILRRFGQTVLWDLDKQTKFYDGSLDDGKVKPKTTTVTTTTTTTTTTAEGAATTSTVTTEDTTQSKGGKSKKKQAASSSSATDATPEVATEVATPEVIPATRPEIERKPRFIGDPVALIRPADYKTKERTDVWYNYKHFVSEFKDQLWYPTIDDRVKVHAVMQNAEYLECAATKERDKLKQYKGVKSANALCEETKHVKFETFLYDYMHYIMNCGHHFLDFFKGKAGLSHNSRQHSYNLKLFFYARGGAITSEAGIYWQMKPAECHVVDSVVNCFYIPTGYKDIFNLQFPFQKTGHLRAKDHMIFLMVYATYAFSFATIHSVFKSFLARFADDMVGIMNPCIKEDDLVPLAMSILETRCIQEGLFPDCQQYYIYHEIIDIVNDIRNLGHVRGLMCFSGERALAKLRRLITKGGVNYMKGLYEAYVALENSLSTNSNAKVDMSFYDNNKRYSDFVLKLYGSKEQLTFNNNYEKNQFLDALQEFIVTQEIENLGAKSPYYRIVLLHRSMKKLTKGAAIGGFAEFIEMLHLRNEDFNPDGHVSPTEHFRGLVQEVTRDNPRTMTPEDIAEVTTQGTMFASDLTGIIKEVACFNPTIYTKAIIKGLKFKGRGWYYSERAEPKSDATDRRGAKLYKCERDENNVEHSWHKPLHYSSWVQTSTYQEVSRRIFPRAKAIGQLNYCFRVVFPSDPLCHGLAFGNITHHNSNVDKRRGGHHYISVGYNFNAKLNSFVCLNYVDSTAFLVSALDVNSRPIYKAETYSSRNLQNNKDKMVISTTSVLHRLYVIPMHPERMSFEYASIDLNKDVDATKVFEK